MNIETFLDWILMILLVLLSKIDKWRAGFLHQESPGPLTFTYKPHDTLARIGDKVILTCGTLEKTSINWYHDGVRVNPGISMTPYDLIMIDNKEMSRLTIRRLTPDLAGRYHCKAYNDQVAIRKGGWLNITGDCQDVSTHGDQKYVKKSGEGISINATGRDIQTIFWTKSYSRNPYKLMFFNKTMKPGQRDHVHVTPDGTLSIASLNILDEGMFTRIVTDRRGCVEKTSYRLEIENSQAEVCGHVDDYVKEMDDETIGADFGKKDQVVGGRNGSASWYAGLCKRGNPKVFCGGTFVGSRWVITAAHCLYDKVDYWTFNKIPKGDLSVKLGSLSPDCSEETNHYKVRRLIKHKNETAKHGNYDNDIALLELELGTRSEIEYSETIRPACLEGFKFYDQMGVYNPGSMATVAGLGKQKQEARQGASTLQVVELPIVERRKCLAAAGLNSVHNNTICLGFPKGGKDSCQGDSGGPLTKKIQGRTFLIGVVSWGDGCARPGKYGYYVDVGKYYDWIWMVKDEMKMAPNYTTPETHTTTLEPHVTTEDYYDYGSYGNDY